MKPFIGLQGDPPDPKCIGVDDLKINKYYRVVARNFRIARYIGDGKFIGRRQKWGRWFLDIEIHWDADPKYGTVQPWEKI